MNSIKKVFDSRSGRNGFTLVELMITVAILSVLAAVAIPIYANYINRAKQADAIIGLKAAQMAQEQFFSENNAYSSTIDILPGFSDGTVNNIYAKNATDGYTLTVDSTGTSTVPGFVVDAVRVVGGNTDRWTISETNVDPLFDSGSGDGIDGFSVFNLIFD